LLSKYLKCSVWRLAVRYDVYIYIYIYIHTHTHIHIDISLGAKVLITLPNATDKQCLWYMNEMTV
jgi:hypothetical protein